jgi:hypothetical protein
MHECALMTLGVFMMYQLFSKIGYASWDWRARAISMGLAMTYWYCIVKFCI